MPRRAHKKSRNGCLECKRRHVKCDEKRPVCSNCAVAERDCEYGTRLPSANARPPLPASASPVQSQSPAAGGFDDQPVNMLHVELFQNLYTKTQATFDPTRSTPWLSATVSQSITIPYLVNELLAFSALHLSTLRPTQRDFYHYHAAQLQTHALACFNETNPSVTHETCVPMFLFSSFLGIHMLCDTLIYRENDFGPFLARFVHYLRLHHGVRTIVGQAWFMLQDSALKPAFEVGKALYKFDGRLGPSCTKLLDLIVAARLGTELTDVYRQAIESLQACANVTETADERHAEINGVIAWPILIRLEFSDLLQQRRPEALVVLAHYAVLLHRYRDSWLFADSGRFVIEEAKRYLGEEWEEWLRWPNEVLQSY
ncbi:hypothetical protein BDW62DRAFT_217579 [Aspergillus aurantiobrunneus]